MVSNSKLVLESVFFQFFSDFLQILDQLWIQNPTWKWSRPPSALQSPSGTHLDLIFIDFWPSNDQNCHVASTKCTSMSVLNVENQSFCKAFYNFPTFFQSKRTSRCPKLVPNDYFCSRGDPFFMGLGEVSLSCRNPWNVKKPLSFLTKLVKNHQKWSKRGVSLSMHVTLFEDTLKNGKVGKRPKRGTKSSNFGASFFDWFLEPRSPKMVMALFVVVVVVFVVVVAQWPFDQLYSWQ